MNIAFDLIAYHYGVHALERFASRIVEYYFTAPIQPRACDHIELSNQIGIEDRELSSEAVGFSPQTDPNTGITISDAAFLVPDDQETVQVATEQSESIESQVLSSTPSSGSSALKDISVFEAVFCITELTQCITKFWKDSFYSFGESLRLLSLNKFLAEQRKGYITRYGRVELKMGNGGLKKRAEFAERIKLCNITITKIGREACSELSEFLFEGKNSELIKRIDSLVVTSGLGGKVTVPCEFTQRIFGLIPEIPESQDPFSLISGNLTSIRFEKRFQYIPCLPKRFPKLVNISIANIEDNDVVLEGLQELKSVHIGFISYNQSIILENLTNLNNVSIVSHFGNKEPVFKNVPRLESISISQFDVDGRNSIIHIPSHVKSLSFDRIEGDGIFISEDSALERLHVKDIKELCQFSHIPRKLSDLKHLVWDQSGPDSVVTFLKGLEEQIKERNELK